MKAPEVQQENILYIFYCSVLLSMCDLMISFLILADRSDTWCGLPTVPHSKTLSSSFRSSAWTSVGRPFDHVYLPECAEMLLFDCFLTRISNQSKLTAAFKMCLLNICLLQLVNISSCTLDSLLLSLWGLYFVLDPKWLKSCRDWALFSSSQQVTVFYLRLKNFMVEVISVHINCVCAKTL